jgi:hypothetical protein
MTAGAAIARAEREAYDQLQAYTLSHGGAEFIHQHAVDAWAAQNADAGTPPIGLTFALIGLYLHLELGFSGRQVQRTHMALGRRKRRWPAFALPEDRGSITAGQVMRSPAGPERDEAIGAWCASVWRAFHGSHQEVVELLRSHGVS